MAYNPMPQGGYFAMQRQPMPAQYQQTFQPQQQVNPNQYWAQQMPPSTNQMRNYPTQYLTMAGQMRPQNPYQMQPQMQPQIGPQYRPQQGYQGVGNPAQFQPVPQSQVITPSPQAQQAAQAAPGNVNAAQQAYLDRYMSGFKGSDAQRSAWLSQNQDRLLKDYALSQQIDTQRQNTAGGLADKYLRETNPSVYGNMDAGPVMGKSSWVQAWLQANPTQAAQFQTQADQYRTANKGSWVNDPAYQ